MAKLKEESNLFLHGNRPTWKPIQLIPLWVKCGGRCTMCNQSLLSHPYFGNKGKYGELAHIIAHSPNGPRPNIADYPPEYIDSEDNIIILCPNCHTMIDKKENESNYSEEWLRKKKKQHEEKIKAQTEPTHEFKRKALVFTAPIGGKTLSIKDNQIREALFPNFFVGNEPIINVNISITDIEKTTSYWQNTEKELYSQFVLGVKPFLQKGESLAVFGIAPIPLLILFGTYLSDLNITNIQNLFRNTNNPWKWPSESKKDRNKKFILSSPPNKNRQDGLKKCLVLSLTSPIRHRIENNDNLIWEIKPSNGPGYESITNEKSLQEFGNLILKALDEISKYPGNIIHVYSAIPNSAAIMFGTKYMKKANNDLYIYDYISSLEKDILAIKIKAL